MKWKIGLAFGIGLLAVLTVNWFWKYAVTPTGKTNLDKDLRTVLGGRAPRVQAANTGEYVRYAGKMISFDYPSGAKPLQQKELSRGVIEKVDLTVTDPRINIVASVSQVTEITLDEVAGVRLRQRDKDNYTESTVSLRGKKHPVFTKTDKTEKLIFILENGYLYTLSLTGRNTTELEKMWNRVVESFSFK